MSFNIKEIDRSAKKDDFDCGTPALDGYLKLYARQNHEKGLGKTYIAVDNGNKVLGYYTICTAQVSPDSLPPEIQRKIPKYPIPAMRIARLAVDKLVVTGQPFFRKNDCDDKFVLTEFLVELR